MTQIENPMISGGDYNVGEAPIAICRYEGCLIYRDDTYYRIPRLGIVCEGCMEYWKNCCEETAGE